MSPEFVLSIAAALISIPRGDVGISPQTAYWKGISLVPECQLLVAEIKYNGSDLPAFARSVLAEPVQVLEVPGAHRR